MYIFAYIIYIHIYVYLKGMALEIVLYTVIHNDRCHLKMKPVALSIQK